MSAPTETASTTKERASATLDPKEMLDTSYRSRERAQYCLSEAIQELGLGNFDRARQLATEAQYKISAAKAFDYIGRVAQRHEEPRS